MSLPDEEAYLRSCRQWIPPRDRYPVEAWYVPKEDVIKMIRQVKRDALEAAAQASDDFHDAICSDCMCGDTIAEKIRALMPEEKSDGPSNDG